MIDLDWIIIGTISLSLIGLLLGVVSLAGSFQANTRYKQLGVKPRGKRSKKRWQRQRSRYAQLRKKRVKLTMGLLLTTLVIGGIGSYVKYEQLTNMTAADTENIVAGYYLLDQMTDQLNELESSDNVEKLNSNIHTLAVRMASLSSKKGSDRGSKESQIVLNRYYARMGQLGVNLSSQKVEDLKEDKALLESYLHDIERVETSQTKVIAFYKVSEKSLAQRQ